MRRWRCWPSCAILPHKKAVPRPAAVRTGLVLHRDPRVEPLPLPLRPAGGRNGLGLTDGPGQAGRSIWIGRSRAAPAANLLQGGCSVRRPACKPAVHWRGSGKRDLNIIVRPANPASFDQGICHHFVVPGAVQPAQADPLIRPQQTNTDQAAEKCNGRWPSNAERIPAARADRWRCNRQMTSIVNSQEEELVSLAKQILEIERTERGILPLMSRMLDSLEQFVGLDAFLAQRPPALLLAAVPTASEKLPARGHQIEVAIHRAQLDGISYDFLRIGRLALVPYEQRRRPGLGLAPATTMAGAGQRLSA